VPTRDSCISTPLTNMQRYNDRCVCKAAGRSIGPAWTNPPVGWPLRLLTKSGLRIEIRELASLELFALLFFFSQILHRCGLG